MAGNKEMYLVSDTLSAFPMRSLVFDKAKLDIVKGLVMSVPSYDDRNPVPVSKDGELRSGVLYESSADPSVRYYLPHYKLHTANGRHKTSLKWRSEGDDPDGPLAWLTIELIAEAPNAGNFTLREIDHEALVRIGYQMPVKKEVQDTAGRQPTGGTGFIIRPIVIPLHEIHGPAEAFNFNRFLGTWVNTDPDTRGMTRLEITKIDNNTVTFHAYGKCQPEDCDWGITNARFTQGNLVGTYNFGYKTTRITVKGSGDRIIAGVFDNYTSADGRPDRTDEYELKKVREDREPHRATLWIEAGALEFVSGSVRRCRMAIFSSEEFDRMYQIMTDQTLNARLELRCFATIGHRTWKQIVVKNLSPEMQEVSLLEKNVLCTDTLNVRTMKKIEHDVPQGVSNEVKVLVDRKENAERKKFFEKISHLRLLSLDTARIAERPAAEPLMLHTMALRVPHLTSITPASAPSESPTPMVASVLPSVSLLKTTVKDTNLSRVYAEPVHKLLEATDLKVSIGNVEKAAVPVKVMMEEQGEPALLRVSAEARQEIKFSFSKETNAYMFDVLGDTVPSMNHILIKRTVIGADGTVAGTFYQDSIFRDQIYYQPQEFRLSRPASSPYLPDLVVAFLDVVGEEKEQSVSICYRVELAYKALPYIDPRVLDKARNEFGDNGSSPVFTALNPVESKLILKLPVDETGGDLKDVERTDAEVSFDGGIVDSIELSSPEFERVFAFFRNPSGVTGLEGRIEARLFDDTAAVIPVNLSFKETTGCLFDRAFDGRVEGEPEGRYRITMRNRIESTIHIDGSYGVQCGAGTIATPVNVTLPIVLKPGESVQMDYDVSPADAAIADIEPVITTSIEPNHEVLWRNLMVNQGYTSETFKISVSIDGGYFDPPPVEGAELLTGVFVEFESDISITFTPTEKELEAVLRMPLLPRLMKEPEAQRYRYRVTNLHASGHGARTNWDSDEGDLRVTPAPLPEM